MNHNKVFEYTDTKGQFYKLIPFDKDLYFSNPKKYKVMFLCNKKFVDVVIGTRKNYSGKRYPLEIKSDVYKEYVFTDNGFFYIFEDLLENKFSKPGKHERLWIVVDESYLNSTSNLINIL